MLATHLVEVLEQVDYPALDLILRQTSRSRVESDSLGDEAGRELGWARNGGASDGERGRSPDGARHGGPQRADDGGTEHGGCGGDEAKLVLGWEEGRKLEEKGG